MRSTRKLPSPDDMQYNLFGGVPADSGAPLLQTAVHSGRRFVTGDAHAIFLGTTRLEDHLKRSGQHAPFTVARLLAGQDWRSFEQRYADTGRAPYAPRLMVGLILYGVMQGVHSLRELERLARLDLGCMWVTGGIAPDHANIGRFIVLHETLLTRDFFESLTGAILKATGSGSARLAGDGTVIEAACSHYNLLKEEAVKARAIAARQAVERTPENPAAQQEQERSVQCQELFEQRQASRRSNGKNVETLRISGSEPEAMVQRLKRGHGFAASYKPSALALQEQNYKDGGKFIRYEEMAKHLIAWKKDPQTCWLKEAPSQALQQALKNLDTAYQRFFDKIADLPTFRRRGQHDSVRFPQGFRLDQVNSRIFLPKLGWLRYRNSREVAGTPRT